MPTRAMFATVVVALCAAGGALALSSGSVSHAAAGISLPDSLPGYNDFVAVTRSKAKGDARIVKRQQQEQAVITAHTVAQYRKAFGGAPAAYHSYADPGLSRILWVVAVRAGAPGVTIGPYEDAKYLGLAIAPRFVQTFGDVECSMNSVQPTVAGKKPDLSQEAASFCQRTARGVTVFTGGGDFTGPAGIKRLVAVTDAAWKAASG